MRSRSVSVVWCIGLVVSLILVFAAGRVSAADSSTARDIDREQAYELRRGEGGSGGSGGARAAIRALPTDTDNDGMPDGWENVNGLNPNDPADAWFDADTDTVYNLFEYQLGYMAVSPTDPPVATVAATGADYSDIETALDDVADGTAVRVAAGTYPCTYLTLDSRVLMVQGGWDASFTDRDLSQYETVLDGGMTDEILYFSTNDGYPVVILDGLHLTRGAGNFGAVNLLARGTASMKTSVVDCTFSESTASGYGGIISMHNWQASAADRTVANTLIAGNLGSGITAQVTGGGQARWRVLNSTITANQSGGSNGQGIDAFTNETGVLAVAVFNTILWGNAQNDIDINDSITFATDYCDIGTVDTSGGADYDPGVHNINNTPGFVGGGDYHLTAVALCRDKGVPGRGPTTDLDGQPRPDPLSGKVDIGCYEFHQTTPTPVPPPSPTPGGGGLVLDSGDYDGDGTSDIALFRGSAGLWSVRGLTRAYFGSSSDLPVSGDYDGDGTSDIGIFRAAAGLWAIRGVTRVYYGADIDTPVPGDYDGDGRCDAGVFRPSAGLWALRGVSRAYFGASGDEVVPGDYDGDGHKDIALFRGSAGLWAVRSVSRVYFGSSADRTVPGDYDGDGTWTAGIFRPAAGLWAIRGVTRAYYGGSVDSPVPAGWTGTGADTIGVFRAAYGLWAIRGVTRAYYGTSGDIPVTR